MKTKNMKCFIIGTFAEKEMVNIQGGWIFE